MIAIPILTAALWFGISGHVRSPPGNEVSHNKTQSTDEIDAKALISFVLFCDRNATAKDFRKCDKR